MVKAGWITKENGIWRIEEAGIGALAEFVDPIAFFECADRFARIDSDAKAQLAKKPILKTVRLENFKKFKAVTAKLSPFTVLMGENGSGKTTLLQALACALRVLSQTDLITWSQKDRSVRVRKKGVSYRSLPGLDVENPADIFYAKQSSGGLGGGSAAIRITLEDTAGNVYRLKITSQYGAYSVKCESTQKDFSKKRPLLIRHSPLFISGFVGLPTTEERLFPVAIQDRIIRGRASDVLRNLLLDTHQNNPQSFDRLREKVLRNFNFEIGHIAFEGEKDLVVHADYKERFGKKKIGLDLSTAGSGFLQVLQILVSIYRFARETSVVLLDEPDAHLHPNLQRTVATTLQEIAEEEELQIIVSTHSTAIIRAADPQSIIPVSSHSKQLTSLSTPDDIEAEITLNIDNFTAGKARIAGRVLYVEDKETSLLERLDQLLAAGIFEGLHAPPLLHAHGKDDKVPFRIRESLEKVTGTHVDVHFIRDSDGIPEDWKERLLSYAIERNVRLHLLPFHEIENILINPVLFQRILSEEERNVSLEVLKERLLRTMQDVISKSRFGFGKLLRDHIHKLSMLIGDQLSFQQSESLAAKINNKYETYTEFEDLRRVAPGKETLSEYCKWIKEEYGIQIGLNRLTRTLRIEDIPRDVKDILAQVGS